MRPIDIRKLPKRDTVNTDYRLTIDKDNNQCLTKQPDKSLSEDELKALPVRDALVTDKRLTLDSANNFVMTNQPDNSAIGTAASKDTGTLPDQIPLNSDLGTSATKDIGTLSTQVPTNGDLGTVSVVNVGTAQDQIETNALKDFKSFDSLTSAIAYVAANPDNIKRLDTASYRSSAECTTLGIAYPDGGGASYVVDPLGAPDGYGDHAAGSKQLTLNTGTPNAYMYGAILDGVNDDTLPLAAYLATDISTIVIGNCAISAELVSTLDDRTIVTTGGGIKCLTADMTAISCSGDNCNISVKILGNAKAATGVYVTGNNCTVENCKIYNLYAITVAAFGIAIIGDIGCEVINNTIDGVDAVINAVPGDAIGACRGIYANAGVPRTGLLLIEGNRLSNILGEEGDGIQLLMFDGTFPFLDGNALITNNIIKNVNRRAVKIQASNVDVINNQHYNYLTLAQLPIAVRVYDIIGSINVRILNNTGDARIGFEGAGSSGTATNVLIGNEISGNSFRVANDSVGIFGVYNSGLIANYNNIDGGLTAIGIQQSSGCDISYNKIKGGVSSNPAINLVSTCTDTSSVGNKMLGGSRSFFIQNAGQRNHLFDNRIMTSVNNVSCIRPSSTAVGSIYGQNYSNSNAPAIFFNAGDVDDQFVLDHKGTGTGGAVSPNIMFTAQIPNLEQPNSRHNDGDISFKSVGTQGGKVGWVCVSPGTPGIWKEFGVIDA